jgi:serine/threonine protein kinase
VLHKHSLTLDENNCLASILRNEAQLQIEKPRHDLWLTR